MDRRERTTGSIAVRLEPLPPRAILEREWRACDGVGSHSFFASWPWIEAHLFTAPEEPRLLRAGDGLALLTLRNARLGGVFPIRQAWFNAAGDRRHDGMMIEHNGFAAIENARLWPDVLGWFAQGGSDADELVVPGAAIRPAFEGPLTVVEERRVAYRVPLADLGEDGILARLSRNGRQQLRRALRAYSGVALRVAADPQRAFTEMKELHIRSWQRRGRRHAFDSPYFEPFHRRLIETGAGAVELLRVTADEGLVGVLYNFQRGGVVSSYQSGFADADTDRRPGYVCHALAIAHYAAQGMRTYDFLAGANRLKQSFGIEPYELAWRRYRRPRLAFALEHGVRSALRHFRR